MTDETRSDGGSDDAPIRRRVLRVPPGTDVRADRFVADAFAELSRRKIQQLLEEGRLRIGGRRVRKGERLPAGAELEIEVDALPRRLVAEPELGIPVLYEDAGCVALDKPAGRPGHALDPRERDTVANFLAGRFPETVEAGANPLEAGLVHRLDTETSGVLLAARTRPAWEALRAQFRAGSVEKRYLAVVVGAVGAAGAVTVPIAAGRRTASRVRVVADGGDSRRAVTRFRPLAGNARHTVLEVTIETGVRHQIRAHLAHLGHPVVGDRVYGDGTGESRHLLHARLLAFDSPATGRRIRVESPVPEDFAEAAARLGLGHRPESSSP